ncbi:DedA family protein [Bacillus seohaeanensis]|uniref:DedA family protein n=1 Tax=Bacillus seohaeanensis TaxID=284580 RepID=A0ABW5RP96_9BACI
MNHELILQLLNQLTEWGYVGIALALMIEVIPSELVLSYAGFMVNAGKLSFVGALISGVVGGTIAQLFLYWLGRYGGRPFFEKYGKFLFIQPKHINASEKWFQKYGNIVIFTARFIPIIRHAISIPAGISKMPLSLFTLYTFAAMLPWTFLFILIGMELGTHWQLIEVVAIRYIKPLAIIAGCVTMLYIFYAYKRSKPKS